MEKLKILIVEDELLIAEDIRMHLEGFGYEVTHMAISYNEAVNSIMADLPDLVMVDITIQGDRDGVELGSFLREDADIPFVYLTSHGDKATVERAKHTYPDAYLLKPFEPQSLYVAVATALANASKTENNIDDSEELSADLFLKDSVFIKKDFSYFKVKLCDIVVIKSDNNYLEIYTNDGEKYLIRSSIKRIMESLPEVDFFQCHKSYIVNLNEIESFDYDKLVVSGKDIPLSKNRRDLLFGLIKTI